MAAQNPTIEREKAALVALLRYEKPHYIFSRSIAGEGRPLSEKEAVKMLVEYELMLAAQVRQFSRSVWASLCLTVVFALLAAKLWTPFALFALLSIPGWFVVAVWHRFQRMKFKMMVWRRLETRPVVHALTREQKIARGYALPMRTLVPIVLGAILLGVVIYTPANLLPNGWGAIRTFVILALVSVTVITMGLAQLLSKQRGG
ncbi:MAG TPA: hypothetical protein VGN68_20025 [Sphingopyxis sp.]|jgi:hypothetical protein|uniref:hypothetical protein n=1 Tax=Sphingopyxis sp. TaxID=1908224 RepID=UPI002E142A07|nr:hypothetical protein [Sphingopyxis sp.]